jgi:hypothetical protein
MLGALSHVRSLCVLASPLQELAHASGAVLFTLPPAYPGIVWINQIRLVADRSGVFA